MFTAVGKSPFVKAAPFFTKRHLPDGDNKYIVCVLQIQRQTVFFLIVNFTQRVYGLGLRFSKVTYYMIRSTRVDFESNPSQRV